MKNILISLSACLLCWYVQAQERLPVKVQITSAVSPAPADLRAGAKVYGFDENADLVLLREGNNDMICIADDPQKEGISVSCYHASLEPFMARGRALRAEGKTFGEIREIRQAEVGSGKLKMPKIPASLFVLTANDEDLDKKTGMISNPYLRYVIYTPYATAESTGLPLKPEAPGMPWIMDPGTHRAHIMINPPKDK